MQNWRYKATGQAKPGGTCGLAATGLGLAHQEAEGRIFGQFRNRTDQFLQSKPGPQAGYPDPLLSSLYLGICNRWDSSLNVSYRIWGMNC